jgi:hypothetical protein
MLKPFTINEFERVFGRLNETWRRKIVEVWFLTWVKGLQVLQNHG